MAARKSRPSNGHAFAVAVEQLQSQFKVFGELLEGFRERVERQFEQIDQRFEQVDQRFVSDRALPLRIGPGAWLTGPGLDKPQSGGWCHPIR
jgi:hypothetical protein